MILLDYPTPSAVTVDKTFWEIQEISRTRKNCERFEMMLSLVLVSRQFARAAAISFRRYARRQITFIVEVEENMQEFVLCRGKKVEAAWNLIDRSAPLPFSHRLAFLTRCAPYERARPWRTMMLLIGLERYFERFSGSQPGFLELRETTETVKANLQTKWSIFYEIEYLMRPLFKHLVSQVSNLNRT